MHFYESKNQNIQTLFDKGFLSDEQYKAIRKNCH